MNLQDAISVLQMSAAASFGLASSTIIVVDTALMRTSEELQGALEALDALCDKQAVSGVEACSTASKRFRVHVVNSASKSSKSSILMKNMKKNMRRRLADAKNSIINALKCMCVHSEAASEQQDARSRHSG